MLILLIFLLTPLLANSQEYGSGETMNSSALEDLAEAHESEPEDDFDIQQLIRYKRNPLSLNANAEELRAFPLFSPVMVDNLLRYRQMAGDLVSVYELQAVPGFTAEALRNMQDFITVKSQVEISHLGDLLKAGNSSLIVRPTYMIQTPIGFHSDNEQQRFRGSKLGFFFRFKYQYLKKLQYGFTGEKDPGEKVEPKRVGLPASFSSFHLFANEIGSIHSIAAGDFYVNMGQGLIQWHSQSFGKTSDVLNVVKHAPVLRPYQSAGESNFFRGIGLTLRKRRIEGGGFISTRKIAANLGFDPYFGTVIKSFNTSGLHRSASELQDRNSAAHHAAGGVIRWRSSAGHAGINLVSHRFSHPVLRSEEPYNLYSIRGRSWHNISLDYAFLIKNYHVFGEFAIDARQSGAWIAGIIASLGREADVAMIIRNFDKCYQSVHGQAFSENSTPTNERGVYFGASFNPMKRWKIDAYLDVFSFSWLKFRVDAPAGGFAYLFQVKWNASRRTQVYTRLRLRAKPLNLPGAHEVDFPEEAVLSNWRNHMDIGISRSASVRARTELVTFHQSPAGIPQHGYLFYADLHVKPLNRWYSFTTRLQYFEADSYNCRVYAFENDVLFASSTPFFYDSGLRAYLNIRSKFRLKQLKNSSLNVSLKAGATIYDNKNIIGSGTSQIQGSTKTDIRFQVYISPSG